MLDWWQASLFPWRAHEIDAAAAWHGRLMVLAWAVILPLGVVAARFFKVTPRQKWPQQLDNKAWWRAHLALQYTGGLVLLAALALIWSAGHEGSKPHTWLGWTACALCALQFLSAWLRGSKGGPTNPRPDGSFAGDHYDMTARRRLFELWHKSVGYIAIAVAILAIASGLWMVQRATVDASCARFVVGRAYCPLVAAAKPGQSHRHVSGYLGAGSASSRQCRCADRVGHAPPASNRARAR